MDVLFVLGGLVGLVIGGEFVVRGAVAIARSFRVSPMVIGLTLVGFGTSLPELVTSVQAAIAGSPGIAVGNVVGSNIANILLILGAAALLAPIRVLPAAFRRDGSVLVAATLICLGFILWGSLGVWAGVIFLACLAGYLGTTFYWESRHHSPAANVYEHEAETLPAMPPGRLFSFGILIAG